MTVNCCNRLLVKRLVWSQCLQVYLYERSFLRHMLRGIARSVLQTRRCDPGTNPVENRTLPIDLVGLLPLNELGTLNDTSISTVMPTRVLHDLEICA